MKTAKTKEDDPEVQLNVRVRRSLRNKVDDYLGPTGKKKYFVRDLIENFFASEEKLAKDSKK